MQKGLVHLYYGDGKGKTTAAVGLGVRSSGRGKKVLMIQFLKDFDSGEIIALENSNKFFVIYKGEPVRKFIKSMDDEEKKKIFAAQNDMFQKTLEMLKDGEYELVILDELVDAVNLGIINMNEVEIFIKTKQDNLEVVITGHNPKEKIFEFCDYITEMKNIRHPYDKGICARIGIEK